MFMYRGKTLTNVVFNSVYISRFIFNKGNVSGCGWLLSKVYKGQKVHLEK